MEKDFGLSTQVIQEFIANALRKKQLGISESGIDATEELCGQLPVLSVTFELILSAIILRRQRELSHWDSTIVAAARELGCHILYSEDLNHGQNYDGVRVINPF